MTLALTARKKRKKRKMVSEYKVEIIFEPTGDYMTFRYEAESDNEADLCNEILNQLSIVSWKEEE
jgi:muconolactone delta-isomerase